MTVNTVAGENGLFPREASERFLLESVLGSMLCLTGLLTYVVSWFWLPKLRKVL